jgi:DNA-directed RNA polymerase specialized sigma24 family protein
VNKQHKRDLSMAQALQIDALASRNSVDPRASLEQKLLIDEFLMQCDPATRDMFCRRIEGFSWKEIGQSYRISSHAAESRFSQIFQKVRGRLGLK